MTGDLAFFTFVLAMVLLLAEMAQRQQASLRWLIAATAWVIVVALLIYVISGA